MTQSHQDYDRLYSDLEIKDKSSPTSLVNLCPSVVANRILAIPDSVYATPEDELFKAAKGDDKLLRLRISFWEEYRRATRMNQNMNMRNVFGGIYTSPEFYKIIENSFKLAYVSMPLVEVQLALEELVHIGLSEMKKILSAPMEDKNGMINPKLAMVKLRIFEDILNRRRGHVLRETQVNVNSKSINLNVEKKADNLSMEEINKRIAELEGKPQQLSAPEANLITELREVSHEEEKEAVKV